MSSRVYFSAFDANKPYYMPEYKTEYSSGMDLKSAVDIVIPSGKFKLVDTNLKMKLDVDNMEAQVRPRSGLSLKNGIFVLNSPGTIDYDYTGSIGVILANFSDVDFHVEIGMRIAQLVLVEVVRHSPCYINNIDYNNLIGINNQRLDGGFGSTGVF